MNISFHHTNFLHIKYITLLHVFSYLRKVDEILHITFKCRSLPLSMQQIFFQEFAVVNNIWKYLIRLPPITCRFNYKNPHHY